MKSKLLKLYLFSLMLLFLMFLNTVPTSAQSCATPPPGTQALANGLVSAKSLESTVYTTTGSCIVGNEASIFLEQAKIKFDSYDNLKKLFYDQSKFATKSTTLPPSFAFSGSSLYYINSDLTVNSNASGNGVIIIFVDGDLTISTPTLSYADSDSTSGLVFIVKGDINIAPTVTQINAVLISEGDICTGYSSGTCPSSYQLGSALTINGSLISINPDTSTNHIKFVRTLSDNSVGAAESVNAQPKYLVILKEILATDLTIVSER